MYYVFDVLNTLEVSHERKTEVDGPFADILPFEPRCGPRLRRAILTIRLQGLAVPAKQQLRSDPLSQRDSSRDARANRSPHAGTYRDARANRSPHAGTYRDARANRSSHAGTYCDACTNQGSYTEAYRDAHANQGSYTEAYRDAYADRGSRSGAYRDTL